MTVPLTSQNSQPAQSEVPPPQYDSDNLANGEENIFTLPIGNHVDSVLEGNIQSMCDLCQDIRTTMRQIEAGLRGLDGHQSSALNTQWPLLREEYTKIVESSEIAAIKVAAIIKGYVSLRKSVHEYIICGKTTAEQQVPKISLGEIKRLNKGFDSLTAYDSQGMKKLIAHTETMMVSLSSLSEDYVFADGEGMPSCDHPIKEATNACEHSAMSRVGARLLGPFVPKPATNMRRDNVPMASNSTSPIPDAASASQGTDHLDAHSDQDYSSSDDAGVGPSSQRFGARMKDATNRLMSKVSKSKTHLGDPKTIKTEADDHKEKHIAQQNPPPQERPITPSQQIHNSSEKHHAAPLHVPMPHVTIDDIHAAFDLLRGQLEALDVLLLGVLHELWRQLLKDAEPYAASVNDYIKDRSEIRYSELYKKHFATEDATFALERAGEQLFSSYAKTLKY